MLLVGKWSIQVKSIRKLSNGFLDICMVLQMHVYNLENLKLYLLVMWTLIMLAILIKEGHSQVMYSPLVDVLLDGKQVCKLQCFIYN